MPEGDKYVVSTVLRNYPAIMFLKEFLIGHPGFIAGGCFKSCFTGAKPHDIDMEAWSGCVCTTSDKSCCTCVSMNCHICIRQSEYKLGRYCSACGRPLTEEARAELEKRLRG